MNPFPEPPRNRYARIAIAVLEILLNVVTICLATLLMLAGFVIIFGGALLIWRALYP